MGFVFKKLTMGEIISSSGGMVFRKLSTKTETPIPPVIVPAESVTQGFNLGFLIVPPGKYMITATALSTGLEESEHSNSVNYTRK